jgi:hypothetical protein
MSSIMRWRNGLTVGVLMETPVLDEVDNTSILKTGNPATLSMISVLVNVLAERPLQRAIAQQFSAVAQLRHDSQARQCPVLRQERTQFGQTAMPHFDPNRT